jgi:FAD/FMN-containing dehydrogenase
MPKNQTLAPAMGAAFKGQLIEPWAGNYDEARKLWNGMVDRRPALIARCTNVTDVIAAVGFGREQNLVIAIKGGGHNVTGNAMCDGGIVIDLSRMRRCDVDVGRRMAHVEGGALLGDLDAATQAHGLAAPIGINTTTGIAGLTLGGGIGHLMPAWPHHRQPCRRRTGDRNRRAGPCRRG